MPSSFDIIEEKRKRKGFVKLGLIDPDKKNDINLVKIIKRIERDKFDGILIGGSSISDSLFQNRVNKIVNNTSLPTILFPGSSNQICKNVSSILFLNLISGRNPKYLIDEQVRGAAEIYKYKIEPIPTAYILLDGGINASVSKISETLPLSMSNKDIILNHSLAGQYLGNKIIYFDCGSGAKKSIEPKLLKHIKNHINIPIMVGGGITTSAQIDELIDSGASYIVCGTMFE